MSSVLHLKREKLGNTYGQDRLYGTARAVTIGGSQLFDGKINKDGRQAAIAGRLSRRRCGVVVGIVVNSEEERDDVIKQRTEADRRRVLQYLLSSTLSLQAARSSRISPPFAIGPSGGVLQRQLLSYS